MENYLMYIIHDKQLFGINKNGVWHFIEHIGNIEEINPMYIDSYMVYDDLIEILPEVFI